MSTHPDPSALTHRAAATVYAVCRDCGLLDPEDTVTDFNDAWQADREDSYAIARAVLKLVEEDRAS